MLDRTDLAGLYRRLAGTKVLTVYIDAEAHDPAQRSAWRVRLAQQVRAVRSPLEDADRTERQAFEQALERIEAELDRFTGFLPDAGWVGFATPERVWYAETMPVPMPDLVRWQDGIDAAPYIRALKQARPVITVLVDHRRARIFRYRDGVERELIELHADPLLGDVAEAGMSKRATRHTGLRGETATDAARAGLERATLRMLKEAAGVAAELGGAEGFIVVGGTPEVAAALARLLPQRLAERVLERPDLHVAMTPAEVRTATMQAASLLSLRRQLALLDEVLGLARSRGRACLGRRATERALERRAVDVLLLSRAFARARPDLADRGIGQALSQDAEVEELAGAAGDALDAEGEGIAARLRYRLGDAA